MASCVYLTRVRDFNLTVSVGIAAPIIIWLLCKTFKRIRFDLLSVWYLLHRVHVPLIIQQHHYLLL